MAQRARIILSAAEGKNNREIASQWQVSLDMVRQWRQRWLLLAVIGLDELSSEERLADLPRPGAPAQIRTDQMCQIVALACEKPEASGRPISQWTAPSGYPEIADEIMKRNIVTTISRRHAARLLKRSRSQTAFDSLLVDART
jgi:transposase